MLEVKSLTHKASHKLDWGRTVTLKRHNLSLLYCKAMTHSRAKNNFAQIIYLHVQCHYCGYTCIWCESTLAGLRALDCLVNYFCIGIDIAQLLKTKANLLSSPLLDVEERSFNEH